MTERLLIFSDVHVPTQDRLSIELLKKAIKVYKPDILINNGDFLNFDAFSRFDAIEDFETTLADEIREGHQLLSELVFLARSAKDCQVFYVAGNHELRLQKWMYKNARVLNQIKSGDYSLISVPNLLHLDDLKVQWVNFMDYISYKGLIIEHGHNPRKGAGATARARLASRLRSGFSGDCHRLALIHETLGADRKQLFWAETGCFQRLEVGYIHKGESTWTNGFAIAEFDGANWHPQIIPIIDYKFRLEGKVYDLK